MVIAGAFNPAILTPQWVAVQGLGRPENEAFPVEMLAPVGGPGFARISFGGFSYTATFNAVTLHLNETDIPQCEIAVKAAANILAQLPHTPVTGVGFNFAFLTEQPSKELLRLVTAYGRLTDSFPDSPEVVARRWGNTIKWDDALVSVDCELVGSQATISFNFHHSVSSANEAEKILRHNDAFQKHLLRANAAANALTE